MIVHLVDGTYELYRQHFGQLGQWCFMKEKSLLRDTMSAKSPLTELPMPKFLHYVVRQNTWADGDLMIVTWRSSWNLALCLRGHL